jgi:hypothetical protein
MQLHLKFIDGRTETYTTNYYGLYGSLLAFTEGPSPDAPMNHVSLADLQQIWVNEALEWEANPAGYIPADQAVQDCWYILKSFDEYVAACYNGVAFIDREGKAWLPRAVKPIV